jgi:tRNA dimethylallyltransferase
MADVDISKVWVLTGPTGSGKTELGTELAERLDAEIVSMDSMALYRGMDIGTAKPGPAQRQRVRHHLIDVLDPWESASVVWWLKEAVVCCREIAGRGKRILFVGGTPLYLKAMLRGLFDGPAGDPSIRSRLEHEARIGGSAALHAELTRVDPIAAARLHPNDLRRIIRALEVFELTGQRISARQKEWRQSEENQAAACRFPFPVSAFWIDLPRTELYARINARVEAMFAAGLIQEVRNLRDLPRPEGRPALSREAAQALGYKEVLDHLKGLFSPQETLLLVQTRSRHFAKRQISWFRHLPEVRPIHRELTDLLPYLTIGE